MDKEPLSYKAVIAKMVQQLKERMRQDVQEDAQIHAIYRDREMFMAPMYQNDLIGKPGFCENCGVQGGETVRHLHAGRSFDSGELAGLGDIVFQVILTEKGYLCQFCKGFSGASRRYSHWTGRE